MLSASYHYHYDKQENTLSDGENQYRYDSLNRLTEIETQNGDLQKNRYDGEGLRAELEENGELTRFLYSGRDVVVEQDGKSNTIRYVRGLELLSSDCECARTYYHYASDELGSITHVTDVNGTVLNRYAYDAFGNRTVKEEAVQNRLGFTGEICDGLTGQYYLRARFYNPVIGRFLNEDTYYGDGLNLYSYCRNNPVRYVDPSGHWCEDKQARINKYKKQGFSEADAEKMANYEKLRETEGVDAAEKYLREQKALGEVCNDPNIKALDELIAELNAADGAKSMADVSILQDWANEYGVGEKFNYVKTPYGYALQSLSDNALDMRNYVDSGGTLYRGGTSGWSKTVDAQFWATESPLNAGYADRYGVDFVQMDFIQSGALKSGTNFITRPAPGLNGNMGGGIEVVTPAGTVSLNTYNTLD